MTSLRYRPDIDGLRAFAVLAVIIYHAFPKSLPGGFIGVDIFFVISGYLISGILYKGHREGDFSVREFYARRVKRLFPTLIVVLLLTMAYGWLILMPDEFEQIGKHAASSCLFVQNFVFLSESGYFDRDAWLKPLLHLWSLAVEEQFYIFFPPILWVIWRRKWPITVIFGVVFAVSFIGNLVMSIQAKETAFFLTSYRAWEFLGGSILALWHNGKSHSESQYAYNILSIVGLIFLLAGVVCISHDKPYPGWRALIPFAGTLLLIHSGKHSFINRHMLSNRICVGIGLISYPLYLFHWPALSYLHIVKGSRPEAHFVMAALGIGLVLTLVTYVLVEKPLRYSKSRMVVPGLIGVFLMTGILALLVWNEKIPIPNQSEVSRVGLAIADKDSFMGWNIEKSPVSIHSAGGSGAQTVFLGDSNMEHYAPRILSLVGKNTGKNRGAIFITSGGVPPIPDYETTANPVGKILIPAFEERLGRDSRVDRVVIAALWPPYFSRHNPHGKIDGFPSGSVEGNHRSLEHLGKMIRKLSDSGKKVTVVLGVPSGNELDPIDEIARGFLEIHRREARPCRLEDFNRNSDGIFEKISDVARAAGAEVIDPVDFLSTNSICLMDCEGIPIRYNKCHLRPGYVREHIRYLDHTVVP